jgi:hypothetical protein
MTQTSFQLWDSTNDMGDGPTPNGQGFFDDDLYSTPTPMSPSEFVALPQGTIFAPQLPIHSSSSASTKKNRVRKGEGPDAGPDRLGRDHYAFRIGHFYALLKQRLGWEPWKWELMAFCTAIEDGALGLPEKRNRYARRRMPNAYGWLDDNQARSGGIPQDVVDAAFAAIPKRRW